MKKDAILKMLSTNVYVSGEDISNQLGISRTAVWKHIKNLQKIGYHIESKPNKGYLLCKRPNDLIPEEIVPRLNTGIIGQEFYHLKNVDSTNRYAKQLMEKNPKEGTVILSEIQTFGRGRKSRPWISSKDGLWFSVILFPHLSPQQAMYVTMTASIAIVQAIQTICGLDAEIKWPNDILIRGKKVCGILTEIDAEIDQVNYSIIGIGMNVNNKLSDELKEKAISLQMVKKTRIDRKDLLCSILEHFDTLYIRLKDKRLDEIKKKWLSSSKMIGKNIIVHGEKESISGTVMGIDDQGCLLLKDHEGMKQIVTGDIEYIKK